MCQRSDAGHARMPPGAARVLPPLLRGVTCSVPHPRCRVRRMLAQVLYPDAGASPAAAANALLAASQQQQQQQQPMGAGANPWMAAAAAAAAAGGQAAPAPSWPGGPPPGMTPGWPPPEGMPGQQQQQQHAFAGWQGAGSLATAQAAAMMAAASGQAMEPSLQGQMAGLPPHMLGVGASSAFRSVAAGNGNISGLSNGSGGSTATALLPQAKHAQSYDSAQ
jgi:hypothetical protein